MDELTAITKLKIGDIRGLEILVRKYQLEAVRIAYPITNDLGLAEEVVQEVFIRVYQRIHQYDETRPFRAWFLRIVVNDALKTVKSQERLVSLEDDELFGQRAAQNNSKLRFEQEEFSDFRDDCDLIQELMQQLTPEHRAVLELKYYLEMSDDEIAETVQIPSGTVKSRLHSAKNHLRALVKRMNLPVFA
ncbi:MAG: RNA polymerase sigma factor [Anaerolineales bacterium]|nr:RNA polymerase sigma factor [Anaerolineales bacterium]